MLKLIKKTAFLSASLLMLSFYAPVVHAETVFSAGGGAVLITSPYKDHDNTLVPFPMIHLEAKHVYIRGYSAGVFLWTDDNDMNELSIGLRIGENSFDADNTDDRQVSRLNDRDRTLDAYVQYILRTKIGNIGARISHDTLDNANGFTADAFYRYPINIGAFTVTPGAGVKWESEERTDSYYGISGSESRRSGLSAYNPNDAISPFLTLDARYTINDRLHVFAGAKVEFLSDEIEDSPMVDENKIILSTVGVTYSF